MSLFFYNISVFNLLIKIVQATYLPPDRHAEVPRMISKDLGLATAATSGGIWLFPEHTSNVPELTKLSYVIMVDSCDRYHYYYALSSNTGINVQNLKGLSENSKSCRM